MENLKIQIGTPSQFNSSKSLTKSTLRTGDYFLSAYLDELVGSLRVVKYAKSYIIREVTTLENARGKGIGTAMMSAILEFLAKKKMPIYLYVDPANSAVRIYKKLGFTLVKQNAAWGDKYMYIK